MPFCHFDLCFYRHAGISLTLASLLIKMKYNNQLKNKLMNAVTCAPRNRRRTTNATYFQHTPRVNALKDDNGYTLEIAIPGINKNEITIETGDKLLTIQHTSENREKRSFHRKGFDLQGFKRQFRLPRNIDVSAIAATYEAGILILSLPLAEAAKPRTISIH